MRAERFVDNYPVNPVLPKGFWNMANERRPRSHNQWWGEPFVVIVPNEAWPGGLRYDTYCLDGGAWDRPTAWGKFGTLEEAIACAKEGPAWRDGGEGTSRCAPEGPA
jgi:hypothetical protein